MPKDDRRKAFNAAKSAVNAYAKDPSDENAERVQSAWEAVKDQQAASLWQQQSDFWLRSDFDSEDDLKHVIEQALEDARNRGVMTPDLDIATRAWTPESYLDTFWW